MADEMKKPAEMIPERDIKPMADEADSIMLDDALDNVESALGPKEGMAADVADEADVAEDATMDTKPIEQALGVSADRAKAIFEAAQMMPRFDGMSPSDIAEMLAADMQIRMQVEQLAARMEDMAAQEGAMAEDKPMEAMPEEGKEDMGGYSMNKGMGGASLGRPDMRKPTQAVAKEAMGGPSMSNAMTAATRAVSGASGLGGGTSPLMGASIAGQLHRAAMKVDASKRKGRDPSKSAKPKD